MLYTVSCLQSRGPRLTHGPGNSFIRNASTSPQPSTTHYLYALLPPPQSGLRIVALLRMLSTHTESSRISRTCAGLTALVRRLFSPEPPPIAVPESCSSKLKAELVEWWPGDVGLALGKLSGCWYNCSCSERSALPDQLRWPTRASSAESSAELIFLPRGFAPSVCCCWSTNSSSSPTKMSGIPSCGIPVIRAERFNSICRLNLRVQYLCKSLSVPKFRANFPRGQGLHSQCVEESKNNTPAHFFLHPL